MKAVKEQTKLQESSRDKVKSHSEPQTLEKAVSLMVAMWNYLKCYDWSRKTYQLNYGEILNPSAWFEGHVFSEEN